MPNNPAPPHARFPLAAAAGLALMVGAALGAGILYLDQPMAGIFALGIAVGATSVGLLIRRRRPRMAPPFPDASKTTKRTALPKRPAAAKPLEIDMAQFVQPGELKRIEQQRKIAAVRDHPSTSEEERAAAARAITRKRRTRKEA